MATLADEDCATPAERLLHREVMPLEYFVCDLACLGWHFNRDQLVLIGFNEPIQKDGSRYLAAAFSRHNAWIRQRRERLWCWRLWLLWDHDCHLRLGASAAENVPVVLGKLFGVQWCISSSRLRADPSDPQ